MFIDYDYKYGKNKNEHDFKYLKIHCIYIKYKITNFIKTNKELRIIRIGGKNKVHRTLYIIPKKTIINSIYRDLIPKKTIINYRGLISHVTITIKNTTLARIITSSRRTIIKDIPKKLRFKIKSSHALI